MGEFSLRTCLVQGRLAFAMRRAAAARANEFGLQILTPPQLAAQLAGGLRRPASTESIEAGIRKALSRSDRFAQLTPAVDMPGMARALAGTLRNVWRSAFDMRSPTYRDLPRVRDLIFVEDVVRDNLPDGEYLLPDLCALALERVALASKVVGPLRIEGMHAIDPVWQPLIVALRLRVEVSWNAPGGAAAGWFDGVEARVAGTSSPHQTAYSCAAPPHEVLEAVRWARELIASGAAKPTEIAIAATSAAGWDDYIVALTAASDLPISFVGGRPALTTRSGQRCAALADVLQNGLSQARVRRLLSVAARQGTVLDDLPSEPLPIASDASLSSIADWSRALADHVDFNTILTPILRVLACGTDAADEAAELLLRGQSRRLWAEAVRRAPASALMFTLDTLRTEDDRDPAEGIAWCTADQLAAAPRRFVWLLGMTSSSWPRVARLDPLLPEYIIPSKLVDPDPVETRDLRTFDIIRATSERLVISASRLNTQATRESPSPLFPPPADVHILHRDRIPAHAAFETDRLLARPLDAEADPAIARSLAGWRSWARADLTAHDGLVARPMASLSNLLKQPQSPTSLSLLLRDPLAYVWYYALGWRELVHKERSLTLAADDFGRLVHELLKRAVDHLEPTPGLASSPLHEKERAIALAAAHIVEHWPEHTNVPPPILWVNTVRQATEMCLAALTFEPFTEEGTRSWTEVPFGGIHREPPSAFGMPWDHTLPVFLPDTDIRIHGVIDRLDLRAGGIAVRINDYKTGGRRKKLDEMVLAGGSELQRVMYAIACRTLLPTAELRSRLIYLKPPVDRVPLPKPAAAIKVLSQWAVAARAKLEAGVIYPGVATYRKDPRFGRLAMPAGIESYQERKEAAIRSAAEITLSQFWECP